MSREILYLLAGFAVGLWISLAVLGIIGDRTRDCPTFACCTAGASSKPGLPGVPIPGGLYDEDGNPDLYCSLDDQGEPIVVDDQGGPVVVDDTTEPNAHDDTADNVAAPDQRSPGDYYCATDSTGGPIVVDDQGKPVVVDDSATPTASDDAV